MYKLTSLDTISGNYSELKPLAPDNPSHDFNHIKIYYNATKWCAELNKMFPTIEHRVIEYD